MDTTIQHPAKYACRVPPTIILAQRPTNDTPVLADASSPFRPPPMNQPRTTRAAMALSRVITVRHGYLKEGLRETVAGPMDEERLTSAWGGTSGHYAKLAKEVSLTCRLKINTYFRRSRMNATAQNHSLGLGWRVKFAPRTAQC